jgi:hypothetical protein
VKTWMDIRANGEVFQKLDNSASNVRRHRGNPLEDVYGYTGMKGPPYAGSCSSDSSGFLDVGSEPSSCGGAREHSKDAANAAVPWRMFVQHGVELRFWFFCGGRHSLEHESIILKNGDLVYGFYGCIVDL